MSVIQNFAYPYNKNWFGTYNSNETSNIGYIPIAKNASSFLKEYFIEALDWSKEFNYQHKPKDKYIVVLRDPFERWYSGVAQYLEFYHKYLDIDNEIVLTFLCQRVVLDAHTEPQINFIQYLRMPKITFFKFDKDLTSNLEQYLLEEKLINENSDTTKLFKNRTVEMHTKVHVQSILKRFIKENPKYVHHIKNVYKSDYELISKIKFYGK